MGAYTWFRDALHAHLGQLDPDDARGLVARLADVVFEKLGLVVIDLGPHDNAQVIFETLNARSTPLRAADLVKNLLFRTMLDAGRPLDELYTRFWQPFETAASGKDDWNGEVRQGRLTLPRIDAFLGYFLVVQLAREVQAHQLFPRTRAFVDRDPVRAEEFLREAHRYSAVYLDIEHGRSDDPLECRSLARMAIADSSTVTPVLMWLFANTRGTQRRTAVQALESYLVRRSLCRLTTKNYNRMFLELLRRLAEGVDDVGAAVTAFLAGQPSDSGLWPGDSELQHAFAELPMYRLLTRARLQLVLQALDTAATSAWSEPLQHHRGLSVEHLMPQAWEPHWSLPADPHEAGLETEGRAARLHTIGNLTLISGKLNSSLSHGGWSQKRTAILHHSALALNRGLPDTWDLPAIDARGSWLAQVAASVWPRPAHGGDQWSSQSEHDLRPDRDAAGPPRGSQDRRQPGLRSPRRGDIAVHIQHAFADKPAGTILSISQIAQSPSPEYEGRSPSQGAISARLFPSSGRCTVTGVIPDWHAGVRGARTPADPDGDDVGRRANMPRKP